MNDTLADNTEIQRYASAVNDMLDGRLNADRFMALRLQHGIYGQRQADRYMARIKLPGGRLSTARLNAIAGTIERYSDDDYANVTTRQDIQIHNLQLADTPRLMADLAETGLTTREACGNTVRNVTTCALAGVCPHEHCDVGVVADATARHFMRNPLAQHLPRKFKISFSGCEADCAQAMIHDVGVVAVNTGKRLGFKLHVAGGLGHKPYPAHPLERLYSAAELIPAIEAVVSLHNKHSDRQRRARARLKFWLQTVGPEPFKTQFEEAFARCRSACSDTPPSPDWSAGQPLSGPLPTSPRAIMAQKQPDCFALPISLPNGQITAVQLRAIAALMDRLGLQECRATQDQNLLILNVPQAELGNAGQTLLQAGLTRPTAGDDVVACPGTTTCRLGITDARALAGALHNRAPDLRLRISGCHNGCGHHYVSDIGFHGEGKRRHGRLIPHYTLHLGGDGRGNRMRLGLNGPAIPALRTPDAVARIHDRYLQDNGDHTDFSDWAHSKGKDYFDDLLADLTVIDADNVSQLARDYGDEEQFKVVPLGGGECAGAAQDYIAHRFSAAAHEGRYRDAFRQQRALDDALACAHTQLTLIGEALLFVAGEKTSADVAANTATFAQRFADTPAIAEGYRHIATLVARPGSIDAEQLATACAALDGWIQQAAAVCQRLDQQLDLSASLPATSAQAANYPVYDLTPYECPMHYIKARQTLKTKAAGEVVAFIVADAEAADKVSTSLKAGGHELMGSQAIEDGHFKLTIAKAAN